MKKLENKVAVITGGNSGIGLETAKEFALEGAKVAISGRNKDTLNSAVDEIGHDAIGVKADVANLAEIDQFYKEASDKFGKFDVLVVNAGVFKGAPLADFTEELYDEIIDINLKGAFFSVQKALNYLNDGASVIITASTVNEKALPTASAYAASKAAVTSLARTFSAELLDRKIRVNILSPGPIETPIFGKNGGTKEEIDASKNYMASLTPLKRLGTAQEMAKGYVYLASDDSSYMLGAELLLDGGFKTL
ncbi:SDR family oxidoreductase [Mucilaginibacter ginsenosidivorans]|uniref:SDR family oxidoreductase n=1 Tax=Mucilaginibacter ginsenosidivorans TaxID=398053 RepID=A0A5B8UWP2_9SPHI|nr:SDR family oxidoreductase [Mucilaginibacter ginsenosidivorans]QEC63349.1 SDR family oxidoreductase [Mucilaginibacter ginsenosidivorans]